MRKRILTVFAFCSVLLAGQAKALTGGYQEADNGLLGAMQRLAEGRVGFHRLANCTAAVMEASGIEAGELRRLRPGRSITIPEEYLDPDNAVPAEVIAASKRILDRDAGEQPAPVPEETAAEPDFTPEQKMVRPSEYPDVLSKAAAGTGGDLAGKLAARDKRIAELEERLAKQAAAAAQSSSEMEKSLTDRAHAAEERAADLAERLGIEEEGAKLAAHNFEVVQKALGEERDGAVRRAEKAEKEVSDLRRNVTYDLFRQMSRLPAAPKALWAFGGTLLGAALACLLIWVWHRTRFEERNFIRPYEIWEKAPNGSPIQFMWEEAYCGYTCQECKRKMADPHNPDRNRLQGVGLKIEHLKKHLDAAAHSDLKFSIHAA